LAAQGGHSNGQGVKPILFGGAAAIGVEAAFWLTNGRLQE
jgi:hypothetical protein